MQPSAQEISSVINSSLSRIRIPGSTDRVYKEECMFSFDTPETDTGLYVCLNTFWGLGKDFVDGYSKRTGNSLFLHCRRIKKRIIKEHNEGPEKKITRFAIGVDGGFEGNEIQYDVEEFYELAVLPGFHAVSLASDFLPQQLITSVEAIKAADAASKLAELEALAGTWDGEVRRESQYAETLVQHDNGKKIPPRGWKCEAEGCRLTENLWLNLTDGSILCGRKYADGSGGNNHALDHYAICNYPLAVKLGTITADGRSDVFSYAEDEMVEDPYIVKHLAHFGIDAAAMEKTDKSMIEMEIELNQREWEWSTLQESGTKLKPLYGPGYTGMVNLGNSCYLNSVMQIIFSIPNFQNQFSDEKYFELVLDPMNDLKSQLTKLCLGLNSGKYSEKKELNGEEVEQTGIKPIAFRSLIGKGHREFATKRQQDAQEFFLHFANLVERQFRNENPADVFKFEVEDKVVCGITGMVRYTNRTESCLPLPIFLDAAINKAEVAEYEAKKAEAEATENKSAIGDLVRLKIPLESCLNAFNSTEEITFFSTGAKQNCIGTKYTRLGTFPDYLVIQLQKFTAGVDGMPKKLDVSVDMPFDLDLSVIRGRGLQAGEVLLPEDKKTAPAVDDAVVSQLTEMGFHLNAAKRAVISSGNSGSEAATNWIMMHLDDANLNDPLDEVQSAGGGQGGGSFVADEDAISSISGMGFTREQAVKALRATQNNVERAIDWIFSHQDDMDVESPNETGSASATKKYTDGPGKYTLLGFVSHMGSSTMCGHYVAHIRKGDHWVIFNDSKVAESENLPKDLGYLYFYRRASS